MTSVPESLPAPGRLGDWNMSLGTDPRADPRLVSALTPFGMDRNDTPGQITPASALQDRFRHVLDVVEPGNEALYNGLFDGIEPVPGVDRSERSFTTSDGATITLYISRPAGQNETAPGVLQIHGGAMVFLTAQTATYARQRDELAAAGMVALGVDYRTAGGVRGNFAYPTPLDDCLAAVSWIAEREDELGISGLVLTGDSGGANLALATALRAKAADTLHQFAGVYAICPYISGAALWNRERRATELPSWIENDGYYYCAENTAVLVTLWDPTGENAENPFAWPYFASADDVRGLPPHVITVAELDPVRDEGLAYYRTLMAAGVDARASTMHGMCHVADLMMHRYIPDLCAQSIADIRVFADHAIAGQAAGRGSRGATR
ncbi:alpha/beta hydrolase fold domain-containing protein [Lentzea sp. NPDC004782]|uniref:alpha/beta hydrolase fold domain-containing protein n=1 Tax=Lentzea sp. NPDC004782 TaxID=3154458 RepID=UPI0033BCAE8A